jgi:hypothetical protein
MNAAPKTAISPSLSLELVATFTYGLFPYQCRNPAGRRLSTWTQELPNDVWHISLAESSTPNIFLPNRTDRPVALLVYLGF